MTLMVNPPTMDWYSWYRMKLRTIQWPQLISSSEPYKDLIFRYISSTTQLFIQRIALLTWIGELKLATDLWEEEKGRHSFLGGVSFHEFLFRVIIFEDRNPGLVYHHPEFHKVKYNILTELDAFKFSTIPLSELLNMDTPHFSSAGGVINVDFDKRELERIAKMVPETYHENLRLPLILLRKMPFTYPQYMTFGTKLEITLLKKLLKQTERPLEMNPYKIEKSDISDISMLGRRRFKTIHQILPERSSVWLNKSYQLGRPS
jgi:uncharacterized protein (UPF0216 family)